ncbi:hypothetical protein [Microvirga sp. VF16]|uniref:hypothetical protein n=1 Tax=Microvirga sp. VF16 TaxID=2807101 RepID=UPI00193E30DE|nr:hypothetical protein [Microvirga sp. VF16]
MLAEAWPTMDSGRNLNCFNRRLMAQAILRVLAETGMLATKTQSVWWSLEGSALASLDDILGSQRQDLLDGMSPLARRVRTLGLDIIIDNITLSRRRRSKPARVAVPNSTPAE